MRNKKKTLTNINNILDDDIIYDNLVNPDLENIKTVFFNGTCGKYEEPDFADGTKLLLNILSNSSLNVIIGGGDTVSSVNNLGFKEKFTYLSSGGGATLEYVAYNKLKALEFILENSVEN